MVVMRKNRDYTLQLQREYEDYKASVLNKTEDGGFGRLLGKLQAALAVGAHDDPLVLK